MITRYTFVTMLLPAIFSCYVMAVLVQLSRTSLYRTSLLPIVYWLAFRAAMSLDFTWNNPGYDQYNQALAVSVKVWHRARLTQTVLPSLPCLPLLHDARHGRLQRGRTLDCRPANWGPPQSKVTTKISRSNTTCLFPSQCGMPATSLQTTEELVGSDRQRCPSLRLISEWGLAWHFSYSRLVESYSSWSFMIL